MNLKFLHGDSSRISTDITPFNAGNCYITYDGGMYVDMNVGTDARPNNQRIQLTFGMDIVRSEIISAIYPVGSIYISTTSANPSVLFCVCTWERIEDTFLLASGSEYSAGSTGGEAEHTLTVAETPSVIGEIVTHGVYSGTPIAAVTGCFSAKKTVSSKYLSGSTGGSADSISNIVFNNGGKGQAHNNMPPYLAVYVWKRIS